MFFAYTSAPENLRTLLERMRKSTVPKKVSDKHLQNLILPGTGQVGSLRAVLKFLGFVDEDGASTPQWRKYVEAGSGAGVLREILQEKYADLFRLDADAPALSEQQLADIVITNTSIDRTATAHAVAVTFKTLCALAEFPEPEPIPARVPNPEPTRLRRGRHAISESTSTTLATPRSDQGPRPVLTSVGDKRDRPFLSVEQTALMQDALHCMQEGLFRAAYVMAWAAFMDFYEGRLDADGLVAVRQARPSWGAYQRSIAEMRERYPEAQLLEVGVDVHLLSFTEGKVLEGLHARRNQCAHPSDFVPDERLTQGYIYELMQIMEKLNGSRPHFTKST
jgi:hypothetical protein